MVKNTQPERKSFLAFTGLLPALPLLVISLAGCVVPGQQHDPSGSEQESKISVSQNIPDPDRSRLELPPVIVDGLFPVTPQPSGSTLNPGLAVVYFYDYFARHLGPLTNNKLAIKKGRPGIPILYLNHQFGRDEIFDSGTNRGVAMRMHGVLLFAETGPYTLRALSNDGLRVYLGDQIIIDDPTQHSDRYAIQAVVKIKETGWYPMMVEYFQRKGTAAIKLFWRRPGADSFEPVPAEAYAHIPGSVKQ